jgi:hypothetical protein
MLTNAKALAARFGVDNSMASRWRWMHSGVEEGIMPCSRFCTHDHDTHLRCHLEPVRGDGFEVSLDRLFSSAPAVRVEGKEITVSLDDDDMGEIVRWRDRSRGVCG